MGLGLSFGSSKQKSSTDSSIKKNESTNQQQSTNTQGTTATSQTGSTSGSSTGSSTSTQTGATTGTSTKTNTGTGSTTLFNENILTGLEGAFGGMLEGLFNGKENPAVATMGAFDPQQFVNSSVAAAASKQSDFLDATLAGLGDMIGGALDNSSMGILLGNRAVSDSAAAVEGVRANATQTAQGIVNQRAQTALAGQAQDSGILGVLGNLLKGGVQNSTQTGTEAGSTAGTNTASGTTNTAEQTNQNTVSQSMQTIQQLVDALLKGTTSTEGTESTKTTGKNSSTGLSLAI